MIISQLKYIEKKVYKGDIKINMQNISEKFPNGEDGKKILISFLEFWKPGRGGESYLQKCHIRPPRKKENKTLNLPISNVNMPK